MKTMIVLVVPIFFISCGIFEKKEKEKDVGLPVNYEMLLEKYKEKLSLIDSKKDIQSGWADAKSCDAMLWAGKYACGGGAPNLAASEYAAEPGRFGRRPAPDCWNPVDGDIGSKTTWSRDMGIGLIAGVWCTGKRDILERHADYGTKKNWKMGEPLDDGRTVYTPSIIGVLYQAIFYLGGKDSPARVWPSVYSSGLDDYQAHLQMIDIWLRGEMSRREIDLSLDISQTMWDRVKEHAEREPNCPFYHYMRGIYDGSLDYATKLLIESDKPECQYVRGGELVPDVEWLFTARLILKKIKVIE